MSAVIPDHESVGPRPVRTPWMAKAAMLMIAGTSGSCEKGVSETDLLRRSQEKEQFGDGEGNRNLREIRTVSAKWAGAVDEGQPEEMMDGR